MKIEAPKSPEDVINILKNVKIQNRESGKIMSITKVHLEWKDEKGDGIEIDFPKQKEEK